MGERTGVDRVIARRPEGPTKQSPTRHDEIASGASRPRNDEPPFIHPLPEAASGPFPQVEYGDVSLVMMEKCKFFHL